MFGNKQLWVDQSHFDVYLLRPSGKLPLAHLAAFGTLGSQPTSDCFGRSTGASPEADVEIIDTPDALRQQI